jgi:hypothetical protein
MHLNRETFANSGRTLSAPTGLYGIRSRRYRLQMDDALKRFQQSAEDLRRLVALSQKNVGESAELLERIRAIASPLVTAPPGRRPDC